MSAGCTDVLDCGHVLSPTRGSVDEFNQGSKFIPFNQQPLPVVWMKRHQTRMLFFFAQGPGGAGGPGAVGANSTAAGGGGGGTGAQVAALLPSFMVADRLVAHVPDSAATTTGLLLRSAPAQASPQMAYTYCANGGTGGAASGATPGTAGNAGAAPAASSSYGLYGGIVNPLAGTAGAAGGANATYPTTGNQSVPGAGGAALGASGSAGAAGGAVPGAGVFFGTAGGAAPSSSTAPPEDGAQGFGYGTRQYGMPRCFGGGGGASTHGSATGAGLVGARGGNGAPGCGGGGGGGALTGSTTGAGGLGGPGRLFIVSW